MQRLAHASNATVRMSTSESWLTCATVELGRKRHERPSEHLSGMVRDALGIIGYTVYLRLKIYLPLGGVALHTPYHYATSVHDSSPCFAE